MRFHSIDTSLQSIVTFRKIQCKTRLRQLGMVYIFSQANMYIQGSPVEIQTQTHGNLIDGSTSAPPPVLSTISILPLPSSHCAFIPVRKNVEDLLNTLMLQFFLNVNNSVSVKLRKTS
jgi:hypothetical protein